MSLESNVVGVLMPDAHAGYTLPIGAVIKSKEMIFPSYVGYDIGCGMCAVKLDMYKDNIDLIKLKDEILAHIPIGVKKHSKEVSYHPKNHTEIAKKFYNKIGKYQLGTLGGGNHFIELAEGNDKRIWIVVHSGSRGFGKKIAEYYMRLATLLSIDTKKYEIEFETKNMEFKDHNPEKFKIAKQKFVLKMSEKEIKSKLESHNGFKLNSIEAKDYILDMECALEFALDNRKAMIDTIVSLLNKPNIDTFINRNHNHAEIIDNYVIHRKGATHAEKDMLGVIPGNMRDGSFIVKGKGNSESLNSSSHGAGRVMSRSQARKNIDIVEFNHQMIGIVSNHNDKTIDEAPMAYKNIFDVMNLQSDLVEVIDYLKPILNIKG
jgi:tRNA-splicing ligase RtcB